MIIKNAVETKYHIRRFLGYPVFSQITTDIQAMRSSTEGTDVLYTKKSHAPLGGCTRDVTPTGVFHTTRPLLL
ncbi:hypothetical protein TNCV_2698241 [Trichonephila clavipes]|nr:hypothetical protein TNCV_3759691 [Trichonephila clavipes]GFW34844.1 hypothetical protein TNCV_2698241 [Trichonephila clavipes]